MKFGSLKHYQNPDTLLDTTKVADLLVEGATNNKKVNYLFSQKPTQKNIDKFLESIIDAKIELKKIQNGKLIQKIHYKIKYLDDNGNIKNYIIKP